MGRGTMGSPFDSDSKQKFVMGYPSPDGYCPTHQMSNPHPPFQHDSGAKYPHPNSTPPAYPDYYYQDQYGKGADPPLSPLPTLPHETAHKSSFGCVMLILVLVLVLSMCMMALVMWFLFGTYIPEFKVESLKVSNFSASNTALKGQWSVEMSVQNTNRELTINFNKAVSDIIYKDAELGLANVKPFSVHKMSRSHLNFSVAADKTPPASVMAALEQDRNHGMVVFGVMLMVEANFSGAAVMYRQDYIKVWCENLQVKFESNGDGSMPKGRKNTCLIRLHHTVKTK